MADDFTCDPCLCATAAKTLCSWDQAMLAGTLTADDYQSLIAAGVTLTCSDGTSVQTITIGAGSTMGGSVTTGFIPYASAPNFLADSWLQNLVPGVALTTGKAITSDVAGNANLNFGIGGDSFIFSTDGGLFNESAILVTPTAITLQASTFGAIEMQAGVLHIVHDTALVIEGIAAAPVLINVSGATGLTDIGNTVGHVRINLPTFANDAAAGVGGLTTGMLYILTATKAVTSKT